MECPECGTGVVDGAAYCRRCGAELGAVRHDEGRGVDRGDEGRGVDRGDEGRGVDRGDEGRGDGLSDEWRGDERTSAAHETGESQPYLTDEAGQRGATTSEGGDRAGKAGRDGPESGGAVDGRDVRGSRDAGTADSVAASVERSGTDDRTFPTAMWYPNTGFVRDLVEMAVTLLALASFLAVLGDLSGGAAPSGVLLLVGLAYAAQVAMRFHRTQWKPNPRRFETRAELDSFLESEGPSAVQVPVAAALGTAGILLLAAGWLGLLETLPAFWLAVTLESTAAGSLFVELGFWFALFAVGSRLLASGCDRALVTLLRGWQASRYR